MTFSFFFSLIREIFNIYGVIYGLNILYVSPESLFLHENHLNFNNLNF